MDANEERRVKHERVVAYLDANDPDAVLLTRRCNFSWYTCGAHNYVAHACDVGNSTLMVGRDGACVLTSNIEATRLEAEELAGTGVEVVSLPYHDPAGQAEAFARALGSARAAADAPVAGLELPALPGSFDRLRWTLTHAEVERYRRLCRDVVEAVESAARQAEPGETETALAGRLAALLRCGGCVPWVLLVAGDKRLAAHRHPLPTTSPVRRTFMLATCAERSGLIAACTRIAAFGTIPGELARRHQAVVAVDAALMLATEPGRALGEIFAVAQQAYEATGFPDEWRLHHQGGSCGYLPREVKAAPGEKTTALADQAFAWNPTIAGTKSEDTILCRPDGPELLAGTTDWPTIEATWGGRMLPRPGILML